VLVATAVALLTTACAMSADQGGPAATPSPSAAGGVVTATDKSAWTAEVKDAASSASSDLERKILADGVITAAEVAEAKAAFTACMTAYGAHVEWSANSDAMSVGYPMTGTPSPDEMALMQTQQKTCWRSTATNAISLYYQMQRNPQKQDEFTIVAACLVRKGVMPEGYTAAEFARDRASDPKPTQFATDAAGSCFNTPLAP